MALLAGYALLQVLAARIPTEGVAVEEKGNRMDSYHNGLA